MYIIGLEPIPDEAKGYGYVICRVQKARTAATLLAGHERPNREYPLEWVSNHLKTVIPDLEVLSSAMYPTFHTKNTIMDQIGSGREQLSYIQDNPELVKAWNAHFDILEQETLQATRVSPKIQLGMEYVLTAEKKKGSDETTVLLEGLSEGNVEEL